MYTPLNYIDKFGHLTEELCHPDECNCTAEELIEIGGHPFFAKEGYNGKNKPLSERLKYENYIEVRHIARQMVVGGLLGTWKLNKCVYEPDVDFTKKLIETDNLKVYLDFFMHLPYKTIYIDFSKNKEFNYEGCFVHFCFSQNQDAMVVYYLTEKMKDKTSIFPDTIFMQKEAIVSEKNMKYYYFNKDFQQWLADDSILYDWYNGKIGDLRVFILQFLTYISSSEPDIKESELTKLTYKQPKIIQNRFSEIRKWEVGVRYGNKIRMIEKQKKEEHLSQSEKISSMKRPHVRCAHWHSYWSGEGKNKLNLKWIEPTYVNGNIDDIPITIHQYTDKEVEGSSGEELIKSFLQKENIDFKKEVYIREIHKLYDFKIAINVGISAFIEFDGEQHFKVINKWGGSQGYKKRHNADILKNQYCEDNEIPLLRIRYDQAAFITEMIKDLILNPEKYIFKHNTFWTNEQYYSICDDI